MFYKNKNGYYIKTARGYYLRVEPALNDNGEAYTKPTSDKIKLEEFKYDETVTLGDIKNTLTSPKVKTVIEKVEKPTIIEKVEKPVEKQTKKYKFI